jgi:cysteine desulfurase family protein
MSIYLDNAATTFPKPEQVYLAMDSTFRGVGVAPGRGVYKQGIDASRIFFEAREAISTLIGCSDPSRVVFTHNATAALNLAVTGLLKPGDHVVTTSMEHNALARPIYEANKKGVEVTWVNGDKDGYVSSESIISALRPNTKLVAMIHCSNVTGAVNSLYEIGNFLKGKDLFFLVDAAQSLGIIPIDVNNMSIDLLAASGHKGIFGSLGTGFLYVGKDVELNPLILGGTGNNSSSLEQPESLPERFESGTMNTPAIAALKVGVDFVLSKGLDLILEKEMLLIDKLLNGLSEIPYIILYNKQNRLPRGNVVSFNVKNLDPSYIGFCLGQEYGINVRTGLHCAPLAHKTIGTFPEGTVRVSPGFFNSKEDIEFFLSAIRNIVKNRK